MGTPNPSRGARETSSRLTRTDRRRRRVSLARNEREHRSRWIRGDRDRLVRRAHPGCVHRRRRLARLGAMNGTPLPRTARGQNGTGRALRRSVTAESVARGCLPASVPGRKQRRSTASIAPHVVHEPVSAHQRRALLLPAERPHASIAVRPTLRGAGANHGCAERLQGCADRLRRFVPTATLAAQRNFGRRASSRVLRKSATLACSARRLPLNPFPLSPRRAPGPPGAATFALEGERELGPARPHFAAFNGRLPRCRRSRRLR
jgi:hypothetical protein